MEDDSDLTEIPTKCVISTQAVHIRCKIHHIDFEGRSDGDSIAKVVNTMRPRRSIIVRGREDACRALEKVCKQAALSGGAGGGGGGVGGGGEAAQSKSPLQTAFIARTGETVDATTESHIYQVRLPESLFSRLEFDRARDGLLAWVDGYVSRVQEEAMDIEQQDGEDGGDTKKAAVPALLPLEDEQVEGHKAVRRVVHPTLVPTT